MSSSKIACVFGATGFIGRHVVQELARLGYRVKAVTRVPERAYFLKPYGDVGQVVPVACDLRDLENISSVIKGADVVVNCVGILFEKGKSQKFEKLHSDVPAAIAKACKKHKVSRFVHISALGVDKNTSKYARSKLAGEKAVFSNFKDAVILRPSVVFGENDEFFNMFAGMAEILPVLPLIGGGKTKFQPVYVGDVAAAVTKAVTANNVQGKIFCLGGPDVLSFKDIYEKLFYYTGLRPALISLPFALAKAKAFFLQLLPGKPLLTPDQVTSLRFDNIVGDGDLTLADLGIHPTDMDIVLPEYLELYRKGGRFGKIGQQA